MGGGGDKCKGSGDVSTLKLLVSDVYPCTSSCPSSIRVDFAYYKSTRPPEHLLREVMVDSTRHLCFKLRKGKEKDKKRLKLLCPSLELLHFIPVFKN